MAHVMRDISSNCMLPGSCATEKNFSHNQTQGFVLQAVRTFSRRNEFLAYFEWSEHLVGHASGLSRTNRRFVQRGSQRLIRWLPLCSFVGRTSTSAPGLQVRFCHNNWEQRVVDDSRRPGGLPHCTHGDSGD